MNPETVLELAAAALRQSPPDGVDSAYIDAFIDRHRAALVSVIEHAFTPPPARGEPTKWGGQMGDPIPPEALQKGMRVVCNEGHGVVHEVSSYRWQTVTYSGGGRSEATESERHYTVHVRLDSGRVVYAHEHREELAPGLVVPDVVLDRGGPPRSPKDAWGVVSAAKRTIEMAIEKAGNARLPNKRREWLAAAEQHKVELIRLLDAFAEWRSRWPDVPVEGLDPYGYRVVELAAAEARRPDPLIGQERDLMVGAPASWRTRYSVGDQVDLYRFVDGAWARTDGWTVVAVDAAQLAATVSDGARSLAAPLWLLRPARTVTEVDANAAARPSSWWTAKPSGGAPGCIDTTIQVPGYGDVRVVCGQSGRRDVWHNVWVRGTRFGYNGGRWAKGMRPADPVLDAIRGQGITAFG